MTHSPAVILWKVLFDLGLLVAPTNPPPTWSGFVSHLRDEPDEAVCIYDTPGLKDGRVLRTGEVVQHPGVMVMVRSLLYPTGWTRMDAIRAALDSLSRRVVAVTESPSNANYLVQGVSRQGLPIPLGLEEETDRPRELFTLNCLLTVTET